MRSLLLIASVLLSMIGCGGASSEDTAASETPGDRTEPPHGENTADPTQTTPLDTTDNDGDGYSESDGDCDDADPTKSPNAPEVCNSQDDDCDELIDDGLLSTWYVDIDGDGYGDSVGTTQACSEPFGYSGVSGDCDDNDALSCPGCAEICDGADNNCDGTVDESPDEDLDGYGVCVDCDDTDMYVHDEMYELCDAKDNDCDGEADEDFDLDDDGWPSCEDGIHFPDCDDTDPTTHPGSAEVCSDGIDNDCRSGDSGIPGDTDRDGAVACYPSDSIVCTENCTDCDDHNEYVHPYSQYGGDIDNNCDGLRP